MVHEAGAEVTSDPGQDEGMPRWVRLFGLVSLVLAVLVVIVVLVGGGNHGPGQHVPGGDTDDTSGTHVRDHTP